MVVTVFAHGIEAAPVVILALVATSAFVVAFASADTLTAATGLPAVAIPLLAIVTVMAAEEARLDIGRAAAAGLSVIDSKPQFHGLLAAHDLAIASFGDVLAYRWLLLVWKGLLSYSGIFAWSALALS